jgi:DNA-binding phage protein
MTRIPPTRHPFCERLEQRRVHMRWTYAHVAELARVHESTVFRALKGRGRPSLDHVEAIANAMGFELVMKPSGGAS